MQIKKRVLMSKSVYTPRKNQGTRLDKKKYWDNVGVHPRTMRIFRNACLSATNLISIKRTCVDAKAKECLTDFLLSWSEAAYLKSKILHFMNKQIIPITKNVRKAYQIRENIKDHIKSQFESVKQQCIDQQQKGKKVPKKIQDMKKALNKWEDTHV